MSMNTILQALSDAGLTNEEARVYLACLSVGTNPASTIARSCDLKRETCNYTLKKLVSKGILSTIFRDGATFYTPEPPEKLLTLAESRLISITRSIPLLQQMMNAKVGNQAKIKMYQGTSGIETLMEDVLKYPWEALTYTNLGAMLALLGDNVTEFRAKRKQAQVKSRTISTYSPEAKSYVTGGDLFEWEQILFVNNKEFIFGSDVLIYGDKVAIISLEKDENFGFIVESASFARTQRAIFDLAWIGWNMFVAQ